MPEYIPDITIPSTNYVSVNTLSGIAVGTAMTMQLKTVNWVRLVESATQPADNITDGILMTNLDKPYAVANTLSGSLELWAICTNTDRTAKLAVQVV